MYPLVLNLLDYPAHPLVSSHQGSIFPSSIIALYAAYLCFSALQSEPRDYVCNGLGHRLTAASGERKLPTGRGACLSGFLSVLLCPSLRLAPIADPSSQTGVLLALPAGGTLALGMVVTLASVVYAAFRAGSNTALFMLEGSEEGEPLAQRQALLSVEEGAASTSAGLDGVPDVAEATREAVTGGPTTSANRCV